jgi:phosphoglycerate kinase
MNKQTIRDIDVTGKRILVRVDYNVPVDGGVVGDTLRIESSFPTLKYLLEKGCSLVLISHLGEPKDGPDQALSLAPVAVKAAELLGHEITFVPDCVGETAANAVANLQSGGILLLENLRFHPEETANDDVFAAELAKHGEIFVQDAFAAAHRAHASMVGVPRHLTAVSGLLLEREVSTILGALQEPARPLLAIIGGAKISSKISVIEFLLERVDGLLIGGAMANTFLAAQGHKVGKSLYEPDQMDLANEIMLKADQAKIKCFLPTDLVVTTDLKNPVDAHTVGIDEVGEADIAADIDGSSLSQIDEILSQKGTVIWNGPVGITETPEFAKGSIELANKVIASGAASIIGGGDTAAFVDAAGLHDKFNFVSTGGGASLELMAGKTLPGVEALLDK